MFGFRFWWLLGMLVSSGVSAQVIKVDGSSTVFPLTEAVAEDFQVANKGHKVTVGISGTGGGFKKFCRGETDVQNASRPISSSEIQACQKAGIRFIELPVAYDAIAIVAHPSNTFADSITVEELKKVWEPSAQGRVSQWNQIRADWPQTPFKLFGAGADSGTFDYFTEAVVGKAKASRGDYTASEDDNTLVMGISREKNSLGYVPFHYYWENQKKLKILAVTHKGKSVAPTEETIKKGTYAPLSRPLFLYVSEKGLARPEVSSFMEFYLGNSARLAEEIRMIPLPETASSLVQRHLKEKRWGTVYKGHAEVGLKIEDLLKKEKN